MMDQKKSWVCRQELARVQLLYARPCETLGVPNEAKGWRHSVAEGVGRAAGMQQI
jgi:hypothetical protein